MSKKWNSNVQYPNDTNFINRVIGATFAPSNSGNPMITLEFEVVSPAEVEVAGDMYNIAGVKCKQYYPTTVLENSVVNGEKTSSARERVKTLFNRFELDPLTIDWDNVDVSGFRGKCILSHMKPDVDEQRKNPTAAQIEEAKRKGIRPEGDVLKHPVTGKALISYWPKIVEIFALAPEGGTSSAY